MRVTITIVLWLLTSSCIGVKAKNSSQEPLDPAVVMPAEQLGKAYAAIANQVKFAVVSVFSEKTIRLRQQDIPFPFGDQLFREFFGRFKNYKVPQLGTGSGMLLDSQGNILTNYHLIHNVDEVHVQFANQTKVKAKVIAKDAKTDVAIIRIPTKGIDGPVVNLGDSDAVQVGDVVIAIGAPFGLAQTVTHGIISAKGRADVGLVDYEDFLQTDAPINPGNSGGPLVNTRGEVVGMNSAIATGIGQSTGVGFAIPSNLIRSMLPKMIRGEKIKRGELGVVIQNITEDLVRAFNLKEAKGVIISQVIEKSPAHQAGLVAEDIILSYNGKPTDSVRLLRNYVSDTQPGDKVKIEFMRNKRHQSVTVTIEEQKDEVEDLDTSKNQNQEDDSGKFGLSAETLTKELAQHLNLRDLSGGVLVVEVDIGSPAAIAGLQIGDVILEVNHKRVKNVDDFARLTSKKNTDLFLLLVSRRGTNIFASLKPN